MADIPVTARDLRRMGAGGLLNEISGAAAAARCPATAGSAPAAHRRPGHGGRPLQPHGRQQAADGRRRQADRHARGRAGAGRRPRRDHRRHRPPGGRGARRPRRPRCPLRLLPRLCRRHERLAAQRVEGAARRYRRRAGAAGRHAAGRDRPAAPHDRRLQPDRGPRDHRAVVPGQARQSGAVGPPLLRRDDGAGRRCRRAPSDRRACRAGDRDRRRGWRHLPRYRYAGGLSHAARTTSGE